MSPARPARGVVVSATGEPIAGAKLYLLYSSVGGGMVKAVANGKQQLVSIAIEKEAVDPDDVEMLQDLVLAAVNDALAKAQEMVSGEMSKITGGMSIPGLT